MPEKDGRLAMREIHARRVPDQLLPAFHVPEGKIIFPGARIFLSQKPSCIVDHTFLIVIPWWKQQPATNIGVIGEVLDCQKYLKKSGEMRYYIQCFSRVHFHQKNEQASMVEWLPFNESLDIYSRPFSETKKMAIRLQNMFREYIDLLRSKRNKDIKQFLTANFALEETLALVARARPNLLPISIDLIMNILNSIRYSEKDFFILLNFSKGILVERSTYSRYKQACELLTELIHVELKRQKPGVKKSSKEISAEMMAQDLLKERDRPFRFSLRTVIKNPTGKLMELDYKKPSKLVTSFAEFVGQYIVGNQRAKFHIGNKLMLMRHAVANPQAIAGGIFVGLPGLGKTTLAQVLSMYLFDDMYANLQLDGGMFFDKAQYSELTGSSPNWVGSEQRPRLSQWDLDKGHFLKILADKHGKDFSTVKRDVLSCAANLSNSYDADTAMRDLTKNFGYHRGKYTSVFIIDEFDRFPPDLIFNILLAVLDKKGKIILSNGEEVDFRRTFLYLTSNLQSEEVMQRTGFHYSNVDTAIALWGQETVQSIEKAVYNFLKKTSPAFLSRSGGRDNIIGIAPLEGDEDRRVIDLNLEDFTRKMQQNYKIQELIFSDKVKEYIFKEIQEPFRKILGVRAIQDVLQKIFDAVLILIDRGKEGDPGGIVEGDWVSIDMCLDDTDKEKLIVQKAVSKNN